MPKLSKALVRQIEAIRADCARSLAYIQRSDIAVGMIGTNATTTLHFSRNDGTSFYPLAKDIGSDLVGLQSAIARIDQLLNAPANR